MLETSDSLLKKTIPFFFFFVWLVGGGVLDDCNKMNGIMME